MIWIRATTALLPPYEKDKTFFTIVKNKHEVQLFFLETQLEQFNQLLEDFRTHIKEQQKIIIKDSNKEETKVEEYQLEAFIEHTMPGSYPTK